MTGIQFGADNHIGLVTLDKCHGHKTKLHPMYSEAVEELNERNDK